MALSELEIKSCEKIMEEFLSEKRPPAHVRDQLDVAYRIENQSVEIFEVRPIWNYPSETHEIPVAKATYVKTRKCWRVFWQRADLKWHSYEPLAEVNCLSAFTKEVIDDPYACFWG